MMEERAHGHKAATACFALAFVFDVLDVLAHIVIVVGLLHHHFNVGLHVAHHILHGVEGAGVGIAVVSTVAAAVAELLSLRKGAAAAVGHAAAGGAGHVKAALHQALHHTGPASQAAAAAGLSHPQALSAAEAAIQAGRQSTDSASEPPVPPGPSQRHHSQ